MTTGTTIAIVAAVGTILAALTTAAFQIAGSRGPLQRVETITRILQSVGQEGSVRSDLEELRRLEVVDLLRIKKSPERLIFVVSIAAFLSAAVLIGAGEAIRTWSPVAYVLTLYVFMLCAVIAFALYVAVIAVLIVRGLRRLRSRKGSGRPKE